MDVQYYKLEIFIPETHFRVLQKALQETDAGHIGNYDSCLSYSRVTGTWRPLAGTKPFELKVEVTIRAEILDTVMRAVKAAHPYEEPLVNVLPLVATSMEWK